jgi:hypothetical protein
MEMDDNLKSERLTRVRAAFDALSMEDKTAFLAEATASTVARGLEAAGKAFARELDHLFEVYEESRQKKEARDAGRKEDPAGPPPNEPPQY